jgi:uncharacterized membrane protein SpoIIM required for sporulation
VDEERVVAETRGSWDRLARAVEAAREDGVARLDVAELRQMHYDYRRTAADLAYAQTHFPGTETTAFLNRLVSQAHGELYGSRPGRAKALRRFLVDGYPRLVRENGRYMLISAAFLFGAVAFGFLVAFIDYSLARIFVPPQFVDAIGDGAAPGGDVADETAALAPLLTAYITVNNLTVSFTAFAGGATFGVLTIYALIRNGLLLGSLAGIYEQADLSLTFWSLIVPHGLLELTAIAIAGGSGLMLAKALAFPGDKPRSVAFREAAPDAAKVVLGTIPLFIVAGLVEGFFTPRGVDPYLKLLVGVGVWVVVMAYLLFAGRGTSEETA